jgi:hypothetical protein
MAHQGFDLQLTRYDERGWRATLYTTGMEHSPTSATGTGWELTPWHAVQRAAWEALRQAGGKQRLSGRIAQAWRFERRPVCRQRRQIIGTDGPLVVEDDIHEGAMNVQATVVFNEA